MESRTGHSSGRKPERKQSEDVPSSSVKLTVSLPRTVAAFLRWKAEVEGLKRDELVKRIVVSYARKLREQDMKTPPVSD